MEGDRVVTLAIPNGIGDISWMISKLVYVKEKVHLLVAEDWPQRAHQYLELLPWLHKYEYHQHRFHDIIEFSAVHAEKLKTWKSILDANFGAVYLEPNTHLERGFRLEKWLPDLPTNFHYEMKTTIRDKEKAEQLLTPYIRKWVYGISCASYRGSEAWRTWGSETWVEFLKMWHEFEPDAAFMLMGGFWDDLTQAVACEDGLPMVDIVGKTTVGAAVELLKMVRGYVGFSSGLGILSTVVGKKTFMMWPDHQIPLSTSWAPPEMMESGEYMTSRWAEPVEVWRRFKRWLSIEQK